MKKQELPEGEWTCTREREAGGSAVFWLRATERQTQDSVGARVMIGDLAGYTKAEWGLAQKLPLSHVWHLQHLEPREPRARGGTKALLRALGELADAAGVWVTTEAKPRDVTEEELMGVLVQYGQFESFDPDFPAMMLRRPRTTPTTTQ